MVPNYNLDYDCYILALFSLGVVSTLLVQLIFPILQALADRLVCKIRGVK